MPALRELANFYSAECLFSIAFNNLAQWLKTTSKFMKRYADEGTWFITEWTFMCFERLVMLLRLDWRIRKAWSVILLPAFCIVVGTLARSVGEAIVAYSAVRPQARLWKKMFLPQKHSDPTGRGSHLLRRPTLKINLFGPCRCEISVLWSCPLHLCPPTSYIYVIG